MKQVYNNDFVVMRNDIQAVSHNRKNIDGKQTPIISNNHHNK